MDGRKVKHLVKTVLFCFFLESRQLISVSSFLFFLFSFFFFFLSEMLADKLAPDLFVIPADTRDEKVCLVIFVWPLLHEKLGILQEERAWSNSYVKEPYIQNILSMQGETFGISNSSFKSKNGVYKKECVMDR